MEFIDTHCHFDEPDFDDDRSVLADEMEKLGVSQLILPATMAKLWTRIRGICTAFPHCHACYGLHPVYLAEHRNRDIEQLRTWLLHGKAVAIGECGLDFFIPEPNVSAQEALFAAHLKLAREFDLPLVVHARSSLDHVIKWLRRFPGVRGVVHSFAGSQQQADTLIRLGCYLGVGGTVTYPRAQRLRQVLAQVPLECLVLETDAPDQPDSAWRGKRNVPTRLPIIAAHLAELRGLTLEQVAAITTANARRLFNLTAI